MHIPTSWWILPRSSPFIPSSKYMTISPCSSSAIGGLLMKDGANVLTTREPQSACVLPPSLPVRPFTIASSPCHLVAPPCCSAIYFSLSSIFSSRLWYQLLTTASLPTACFCPLPLSSLHKPLLPIRRLLRLPPSPSRAQALISLFAYILSL